jgi:hypothetical protein
MLCWEEGGDCFSPACSVVSKKLARMSGAGRIHSLVLHALFIHMMCGSRVHGLGEKYFSPAGAMRRWEGVRRVLQSCVLCFSHKISQNERCRGNALVLHALFAHKICGSNALLRRRGAGALVLHALFCSQNLPEWALRGECFSPARSVRSRDLRGAEHGRGEERKSNLVLHALFTHMMCGSRIQVL